MGLAISVIILINCSPIFNVHVLCSDFSNEFDATRGIRNYRGAAARYGTLCLCVARSRHCDEREMSVDTSRIMADRFSAHLAPASRHPPYRYLHAANDSR